MTSQPDLAEILAKNLRFFMNRPGALHRNPNALAVASGLAANSVRNYLQPKRRAVVTKKGVGYPTMDKLAAIAGALGCEVWELMHPDIERSLRERDMYKRIETSFALLSPIVATEQAHPASDKNT